MDLDTKKPDLVAYQKQRGRPACASAQSDQVFFYLFAVWKGKHATRKIPIF